MYYHWMRYRDPIDGNFVSKDPIGVSGGVNLYQFGDSDPLNNVDPNGLVPNPAEAACMLGPNPVCISGVAVDALTTVVALTVATVELICIYKEHTSNPRPSNWDKHTKPRAGGPEKADDIRRPPRQKPPGHKGPWPPPPKKQ